MVVRALLQAVALSVILSPFLFLPAGSLNWPMGWALLVAYIARIFGMALLNIWREPELARERNSKNKGLVIRMWVCFFIFRLYTVFPFLS